MTTDQLLQLRPLTLADEAQARRAHEEMAAEGFTFLLDGYTADRSWPQYLAEVDRTRRALDLPAGRVPATFLLADVGGELVGRASIRHELNDWLRQWGGHIGYGVRPAFRRRGYATAMLRQSLDVAAQAGVDRALLVCDDANLASATVIERAGGALEDVVVDPERGVPQRRYWIDVTASRRAGPAGPAGPAARGPRGRGRP